MENKTEIQELSPDEFTYERYEVNYGDRLGLDFRECMSFDAMSREIRDRIVGWCDGERLSVRPREDMVAVMLEDEDFEKFWFHWPRVAFELAFGGLQRQEGE